MAFESRLTNYALLSAFFLLLPAWALSQCEVDAGEDIWICAGESVTIGGSPTLVETPGGDNWSWGWDNGIGEVENPEVSPTSTTTYTVYINTPGPGFCDTDEVTVFVYDAPQADFDFTPDDVCATVPIQFTNNSTGNFSDVTVTSAEIANIRTHLEDRVPAGLQIDIMSAEVVSVSVTASVKAVSGSDTGVVETAISNALSAYLDPNNWDWTKEKVRVNEVIALIDGVVGVDYVESVSLAGNAEIAPAGAQNFTVSTDIDLHNHGTLVGNGTHSLTVS